MSTHGEYSYPDGSMYRGQLSSEGSRHGFGELTLCDGSKYRGIFDTGVYSGLGVLVFSDGSRYEGEFQRDRFHGYGVFISSDLMRYDGQFKDGKICGLGIVTFPTGGHGVPRFEGYFEGTKFVRQEKCPRSIQRARDMASTAKAPYGF